MSKVITDENQLNTEVDDLITEDYALEVLGLKNPADFRKFSRSFMKLSKIVKGIENGKSNTNHLHDDRYYTESEINNKLGTKLDKEAVSTEYDTAKKIEDKIKTAQGTADNKLDKSGYNGTAQTLKNSIDKKVSKAGDIMTGFLSFDLIKRDSDQILFKSNDELIAGMGYSDFSKGVFISNVRGSNRIWLYDDGGTSIDAKNLKTISKYVVGGINEVYDRNIGNIGISEMRYIQDIGVKYRNWGYVDKITKKTYICFPTDINVDTVTDTQVTNNFIQIGTIQVAEQNIPAYYSFANNKRHISKNIVVNNESYKEINLTVKVKGAYYISANGWNLPEHIPDQELNAINIYINGIGVAFAPSSSVDPLPTSVSVVYECNVGDTIRIFTSQEKNQLSTSYSVFKI